MIDTYTVRVTENITLQKGFTIERFTSRVSKEICSCVIRSTEGIIYVSKDLQLPCLPVHEDMPKMAQIRYNNFILGEAP